MSVEQASIESVPDDALVPLESVGDAAPAEGDARPYGRRRLPPDPLYHVVILSICTAIIALALLMSVRQERQVLIPVLGVPLPELCMMKRWTGSGCPGCGMTRCFISLAHGDLPAALHYNPAGPLLFAILAFQIPFRVTQLVRLRWGLPELRMGLWPQVLFGILGVVMVGQWVLKFFGIGF
jgi:hypothetical protein